MTGHYPHEAATPYMVFHLVTDPGTAPDLSGVPDELEPLLTGMLAQDAAVRPSLTEVVQRCRSVIEARGMKIAQARRRLTAHTAGQRHRESPSDGIPTVAWPAPANDTPATEISPAELETPAPADAPPVSPATPVETGSGSPAVAPSHDDDSPGPADPRVPGSPGVVPAEPRDRPDGSRREQPAPDRRPPADPQRPKGPTHSLRHSVQARRTAERLRTAYAAKAPF
ncbi:hypothetical protein AB0A94_08755 [Streptomyces sp. NPDC044984]|uniref:hypothetical protein n=1 Tax=Streptomyces sp. NPDC044984 TaxID=3154335 RepID=UPI003411B9D8